MQTEHRIFFYIDKALGDAKTVLNVGAGAGSYEPTDRYVVAVEPSSVMRLQRQASNRIPAVIGYADNLPDLMLLSIPDDHTAGTTPDFPTPRAMAADNDLALVRIIQTIARSRFWDSTVVFVTEDDSQSGWDHVSSYCSTGLVISPYSELHKTVHTSYNQTCIVRMIEQILGIPPMNIIDATTLPMFDCFTNKKTANAFHFLAKNIQLNEKSKPFAALKGKALYYAKLSKNSSFKDLDSGDDDNMNRILWFDAKGNTAYPVSK